MANTNNAKMNQLIRQNAPETASNPMGKPADSAGNQWFRQSVKDAQDQRFQTVWQRLMSAHAKHTAWENGEDSDNG